MSKITLSPQDILLIQKALISYRWQVGEDDTDFTRCSRLANELEGLNTDVEIQHTESPQD